MLLSGNTLFALATPILTISPRPRRLGLQAGFLNRKHLVSSGKQSGPGFLISDSVW